MKRMLATCALVAFSGCFKFDEKLAACRTDAGTWICGDAGVDGGSLGSGLMCFSDGGWCWEHPRPAGGRFLSAFARAPNDVWFGTEHGLVLQFDGAGFRAASFLGVFRSVRALCGRANQPAIYAGVDLQNSDPGPRLFALDGTGLTEIAMSDDEVSGLDCAADRVWAAHTSGLWSVDWGATALTTRYALPQPMDEAVVGVVSTGQGSALTLTRPAFGAPAVANVRDQDGVIQSAFAPDASQALNFTAVDIWRLFDGGAQLAVNGATQGVVWQREGSGWVEVYPNSTGPEPLLVAGAPWRNGALAIALGGVIVELENGRATERVYPSQTSEHRAVTALPTGEAWVTSDVGCVSSRAPDGGWTSLVDCARFVDFSIGNEIIAATDDSIYVRGPTGWVVDRGGYSGVYGVWTNPDGGGRAVLSDDALEYRRAQLPAAIANGRSLTVLDETRAVVVFDDGSILDTNLTTGTNGSTAQLDRGARVVVDRTTRTFWARSQTDANNVATSRLWRSDSAGAWAEVDAGAGTVPLDVAVGFGRTWIVALDGVYFLDSDGSWVRIFRANVAFSRAIVIDETRAYASTYGGPAFVIDSTNRTATEFDFVPFDPARVEVVGGEIWVLGATEGLIRRAVPPR